MHKILWYGVLAGLFSVLNVSAQPADLKVAQSSLSPDAARMHAAVKTPHENELKWQQIPWLVDLDNAARLAREEDRPLLMFVSGDDPLEKC